MLNNLIFQSENRMENKKWIMTICIGMFVFILQVLLIGANNSGDITNRINYLGEVYFYHPEKIAIAILAGLFIGFIFWFIQYLGKNMPKSGVAIYLRAFEIALIIGVILWGAINLMDILFAAK